MTVSTTIIKNFHNGNASTTNFAYQFRILEKKPQKIEVTQALIMKGFLLPVKPL